MKNFGAMAMNDEELDNVVGGARTNAFNDVDLKYARENVTPIHGFAIESDLSKVLQACGLTIEQYNALAMDAKMDLLTKHSNMLALDTVVGEAGGLAHAMESKV